MLKIQLGFTHISIRQTSQLTEPCCRFIEDHHRGLPNEGNGGAQAAPHPHAQVACPLLAVPFAAQPYRMQHAGLASFALHANAFVIGSGGRLMGLAAQ